MDVFHIPVSLSYVFTLNTTKRNTHTKDVAWKSLSAEISQLKIE